MKKIAAADVFFTPEHREQIEKTAAECGYSVDFYPDGHLPPERAAEYEIVYGCCLPGELKAAANLKWFCCSFAGVDIYMDESIYPHPGCAAEQFLRGLRHYHCRAYHHGDADAFAADAGI